ncbi:MAG: tRNA 2-thiouridine(34) synthase MnmA [Candidatus Omnitrophota bacterium]
MKIVVAMSGGVDSSVAALKLKKEGYELIGITMKTWPKEDCGRGDERTCCSLEAVQYARSVAEDLEIPHYVVDLSREFAREVKDYFIQEYSSGRTPNPCIYCNSRIKFGYLMKKARELGADSIATGHYARVSFDGDRAVLREAVEKKKDQSYFLCGIPRNELKHILFPLGEMRKNEVRELARENGLMSADRRSSQDICFSLAVEETGDPGGITPGDLLDISGKVIGKHRGVAFYTIGQRKGLGLGIHLPLYVLSIDPVNNTVTVGNRENVMKDNIRVKIFNWFSDRELRPGDIYGVRIRHNGAKAEAAVSGLSENEAIIKFSAKQFAPTPGQAAVFYSEETVAGAGWIV